MALKAPSEKSATYKTRLNDNRNWDAFELREGDVIVPIPPKLGTTWTQALVLSLLFENPAWIRHRRISQTSFRIVPEHSARWLQFGGELPA